jgi:hypothetical protein
MEPHPEDTALMELQAAAESAGLTPANFRKMSKRRRLRWVETRQDELRNALPATGTKIETGSKPSRQFLRQMARLELKMPVGMSVTRWHRKKGYPRNVFRSGRRTP